jgi:VWFA-related protein
VGSLAAVLTSTALTSFAQEPRGIFRSGVEVVRLDVSVLDADRRPVLGLTAADFIILVDGVPQPIAAFEPIVLPPREVPAAPWMREIAPDVRTNALGEPRLFIIIMDDVATELDPYQIETGKRIAHGIVEQLRPGDLAAVLFTDPFGRRRSQDFTDDRARLLEAIDHFNFGMGGPGLPLARRALLDAMRFLQTRPQNRGAIFFISPGLGRHPPSGRGRSPGDLDPLADLAAVTSAELADLGRASRVARVPVYWFSTVGLEPPGIIRDTDIRRPLAWNALDAWGPAFIDASGGRSILNTNAPAESIAAVFEENRAYYLIGYRATHPTDDGRYRRLQVRVKRPGVTVFPVDRMVLSPQPSSRRTKPPPSPLFRAMSDILPQSDLPLEVSVQPFAIPRTRAGATTALAVSIGVRRPAPDAALEERAELLGRVFTVQGKFVTSVRQTATLRLVPGAGEAHYELLSKLELKPGRYLLRYSVHSESLEKTGSVYTDLTVPDFSKSPLSLSGIVITATPSPKVAPADALASLIPVVPTTERAFTATHAVQAFVRVYQGGRKPLQPVAIEALLTDGRGQETVLRADRLAPEQFGAHRSADYAVGLPLARLPPGPYLLSLGARAGSATTARAQVRFVVR